MAELDRLAQGQRRGRRVLRGGARQLQGVRADQGPQLLLGLPRGRRELLEADRLLEHAHRAVPGRPYRRQVRALREVGAGMDRDQGLSRGR
ncbi:hypothetical protein SGPA1_21543 [Streptomyces misionensis JCM 4497]